MTLKEQIMKLQTYKMYEGEDIVYVERDDVLKTLEQKPCEDCISRKETVYYIKNQIHEIISESGIDKNGHTNRVLRAIVNGIETFPSVQPTRSRGKWIIYTDQNGDHRITCDKCKHYYTILREQTIYNYCPNCNVDMRENNT